MPLDLPRWADIALKEEGIVERPGPNSHEPRIIEYHQTTSLKATADEVSWCSSFVNWVFEKAGIDGTDSAAARSWMNWGVQLNEPVPWCVVVFWRGSPDSWMGHVGFLTDILPSGDLRVWGGNQQNQVNATVYARDRLLGFRWPKGLQIPEPMAQSGATSLVDRRQAVRDVQRALAKHFPSIMVDGIPGPQTRGFLADIGL